MTRFLDGPAVGQVLFLRRAPALLRVVRGPGGWDALDMLDDEPEPGEEVHAYRRVGKAGSVHIDGTDRRGRRRGAWYSTAEYRLADVQPAQGTMRDADAWRRWATEQATRKGDGREHG